MCYCLNPDCDRPDSPGPGEFCQHCGTRLLLAGRYQALACLGAGGFGRTLRARDRHKPSHPLCAIKQFAPQDQTGARKAAQLFHQEAVRLEELGSHPQIPTRYAHGAQEARQYNVPELIDGPDLATELQAQGPWPEAAVRALLADLLPVLHFIHQGQVIHRDIKPANIIRRRQDQALVLVDFGAAKYATHSALSTPGTAIGSAGYAAPEQQFGQATFASDLYSLAVTCLHLLTGLEPLALYCVDEACWAWRDRSPTPVSDALAQVLDRLLERAVGRRYPSAAAVLQALTPTALSLAGPQAQPSLDLQLTRTLASHTGAVQAIAFSRDRQWLASGSQDCTLNLWQRGSLWQLTPLTGPQAAVKTLAFSPNGQLLASGSLDCTVRVWRPGRSRPLVSLTGHRAGVMALAFSPDGRLLVSGSADGTVKLWQPNQAGLADTLAQAPQAAGLWALAFSPEGEHLVTGNASGWLQVWHLATRSCQRRYQAHRGPFAGVTSLAFSPDGQWLVSGSQDRSLKVWQAATGALVAKLEHPQAVRAIAISPDGHWLASGGDDGQLRLWEVATWELRAAVAAHTGAILALAWSPEGRSLASGGADKTTRLWQGGP